MAQIKSIEKITENYVLSTIKASINIEKHMQRSGWSNPKERALKYAISTIVSSGVKKDRAIELIDSIIKRANEIKSLLSHIENF